LGSGEKAPVGMEDSILGLQQVIKDRKECNLDTGLLFVDYRRAFDSVHLCHSKIRKIMEDIVLSGHLTKWRRVSITERSLCK
jgi:hypothetical protein